MTCMHAPDLQPIADSAMSSAVSAASGFGNIIVSVTKDAAGSIVTNVFTDLHSLSITPKSLPEFKPKDIIARLKPNNKPGNGGQQDRIFSTDLFEGLENSVQDIELNQTEDLANLNQSLKDETTLASQLDKIETVFVEDQMQLKDIASLYESGQLNDLTQIIVAKGTMQEIPESIRLIVTEIGEEIVEDNPLNTSLTETNLNGTDSGFTTTITGQVITNINPQELLDKTNISLTESIDEPSEYVISGLEYELTNTNTLEINSIEEIKNAIEEINSSEVVPEKIILGEEVKGLTSETLKLIEETLDAISPDFKITIPLNKNGKFEISIELKSSSPVEILTRETYKTSLELIREEFLAKKNETTQEEEEQLLEDNQQELQEPVNTKNTDTSIRLVKEAPTVAKNTNQQFDKEQFEQLMRELSSMDANQDTLAAQ